MGGVVATFSIAMKPIATYLIPWRMALAPLLAAFPFAGISHSHAEVPETSQGVFELSLGAQTIEFFYHLSPMPGNSPLVLSLHRNESTAFPLVKSILQEFPGHFIGIKTPGSRRLSLKSGDSRSFTIDPNRMFSVAGIESDLRRFSFYSPDIAAEVKAFSDAYVKKTGLNRGATIIAIHNNTAGGYSINSYQEGGSESAAGKEIATVQGADSDDFILVTNARHFAALKKMSYNVVLQDNSGAPDDGSLSVYCGRNGIDYFNVEAEFGHSTQQGRMLRAVFAVISDRSGPLVPNIFGKPTSELPRPNKDIPIARPIESDAIKLDDSPPTPTNPEPEKKIRTIEPTNKL